MAIKVSELNKLEGVKETGIKDRVRSFHKSAAAGLCCGQFNQERNLNKIISIFTTGSSHWVPLLS
jgi:hypothetical protein